MTLKKLTSPSPDTGADKYFGENINEIVKALTGEVSEPITIGGTFEIMNDGAHALLLAHNLTSADKTATFPDADITVAGINIAQVWTQPQIFPDASIAYSKLVLTGSVVDADIAASGITTRSKLPAALAYEDEANTFSQAQKFDSYKDQKVIAAPGAPASGYVRCYPKTIDANNEGYFVQMKKAGSIVEVQIA